MGMRLSFWTQEAAEAAASVLSMHGVDRFVAERSGKVEGRRWLVLRRADYVRAECLPCVCWYQRGKRVDGVPAVGVR